MDTEIKMDKATVERLTEQNKAVYRQQKEKRIKEAAELRVEI